MSAETGWFADLDRDADSRWPWRPCLETGDGLVPSLDMYFATEKECEAFIRDTIIPNASKLIARD
jgi:hypothetical protein